MPQHTSIIVNLDRCCCCWYFFVIFVVVRYYSILISLLLLFSNSDGYLLTQQKNKKQKKEWETSRRAHTTNTQSIGIEWRTCYWICWCCLVWLECVWNTKTQKKMYEFGCIFESEHLSVRLSVCPSFGRMSTEASEFDEMHSGNFGFHLALCSGRLAGRPLLNGISLIRLKFHLISMLIKISHTFVYWGASKQYSQKPHISLPAQIYNIYHYYSKNK